MGETVRYNGQLCLTTFYACSAGVTASSQNVWGARYAYLQSVDSSYDREYKDWEKTKTYSASSLQATLESKLGITLDPDDKENWFEILSYYDEVYVDTLRIGGSGGTTITGRKLREQVLGGTNLRSVAFEVEYDAAKDQFRFTTWGYGHGVGLSQAGAMLMAKDGWNYVDILEHYYPGAVVE